MIEQIIIWASVLALWFETELAVNPLHVEIWQVTRAASSSSRFDAHAKASAAAASLHSLTRQAAVLPLKPLLPGAPQLTKGGTHAAAGTPPCPILPVSSPKYKAPFAEVRPPVGKAKGKAKSKAGSSRDKEKRGQRWIHLQHKQHLEH